MKRCTTMSWMWSSAASTRRCIRSGRHHGQAPELRDYIRSQLWVSDVVVRVRERGREFLAEAFVVPTDQSVSLDAITDTAEKASRVDPRVTDMVIAPVKQIPDDLQKARRAETAKR